MFTELSPRIPFGSGNKKGGPLDRPLRGFGMRAQPSAHVPPSKGELLVLSTRETSRE